MKHTSNVMRLDSVDRATFISSSLFKREFSTFSGESHVMYFSEQFCSILESMHCEWLIDEIQNGLLHDSSQYYQYWQFTVENNKPHTIEFYDIEGRCCYHSDLSKLRGDCYVKSAFGCVGSGHSFIFEFFQTSIEVLRSPVFVTKSLIRHVKNYSWEV